MSLFLKNWDDEKPEPFKRICVIDKNGNRDGHLTPLYWDGKHLAKSVAHRLKVDENNIDKWCYYNEI